MNRGVRLYVGCGLTLAPPEFRDFVSQFKEKLKADGYEILEFLGLVNGTAADVWNHDLNNVATCDCFVAIVDEPSTGLGIELNEARRLGKPILCLLKSGAKATRMLYGARDLGYLSLEIYTTVEDAIWALKLFVAANPALQPA